MRFKPLLLRKINYNMSDFIVTTVAAYDLATLDVQFC